MKLWDLSGQDGQVFNSTPPLRALAIANMRAEAPIFEQVEFYSMLGSGDTPRKNNFPTGGKKRTINSTYTPVRTEPEFAPVALKIMGDILELDIAWERRGGNIVSERETQLIEFARSLGRYFSDMFINATPDAQTFHGLRSLIPAARKFVLGSMVPGATGNGALVPTGNSDANKALQQKFLEQLNLLVRFVAGGAGLLLANSQMVARISSLARELVQVTTVQNAVGEMVNITSYLGVPMLDPGYKADGSTQIIGTTETCGSSTDCTSIYAVRFGEKRDLTVATNVGVQVLDLGLVGAFYQTFFEFDADPVLLNDKAVAQLQGIRLG
jgi:hypothetical protein